MVLETCIVYILYISHVFMYYRAGMVMVFFSSTRLHDIVSKDIIDNQLKARVEEFSATAHDIVDKVGQSQFRACYCLSLS